MQKRIAGLDGIRAVAVLLVFLQHQNTIALQFRTGLIGVWAFFVLSGFLIIRLLFAARAEIEWGESNFGVQIGRFFANRTARIFPIYYLVLALVTVFAAVGYRVEYFTSDRAVAFWLYLTNIKLQRDGSYLGIFTHLWSLSIEEQFYVLAAPVCLALPRRLFTPLLTAIVGLGLARRIQLSGTSEITYTFDSIVNFYMLALGGLAGIWADRFKHSVPLFYVASFCVLGSFAVELVVLREDSYSLILVPPYMALVYLFIFNNQHSMLVRVLSFPPLMYLGTISYGFYLYHGFAHIDLLKSFGVNTNLPSNLKIAIEFLVSLTTAVLSWHWIERPILRSARGQHSVPQ
ncbi:peptidoglycan/LPS O-acetylase OafA/YrhL [Bradyrhizobium sp. USDA 4449]